MQSSFTNHRNSERVFPPGALNGKREHHMNQIKFNMTDANFLIYIIPTLYHTNKLMDVATSSLLIEKTILDF